MVPGGASVFLRCDVTHHEVVFFQAPADASGLYPESGNSMAEAKPGFQHHGFRSAEPGRVAQGASPRERVRREDRIPALWSMAPRETDSSRAAATALFISATRTATTSSCIAISTRFVRKRRVLDSRCCTYIPGIVLFRGITIHQGRKSDEVPEKRCASGSGIYRGITPGGEVCPWTLMPPAEILVLQSVKIFSESDKRRLETIRRPHQGDGARDFPTI